ncbi:hypothetical protein JCM31447_12280 [Fluviispira sanaruensis]|uniref:Uncharacterized protein n=1 Tax=Fluviispira sanaruensis TaxID=2493639 RepID=A0A4P2VTQ1_FLUSA|nr:hypothetical protein JCM31447_12280 [Fluviispira sanaruensis]
MKKIPEIANIEPRMRLKFIFCFIFKEMKRGVKILLKENITITNPLAIKTVAK